jgi:hypothetical protein
MDARGRVKVAAIPPILLYCALLWGKPSPRETPWVIAMEGF